MPGRVHALVRHRRKASDERRGEPLKPELAHMLRRRLTDAGHERLALSVDQLLAVERCHCGEPGCASFYTVSAGDVEQLWRQGGSTITLAPGLTVDVVDGLIVAVEIIEDAGP